MRINKPNVSLDNYRKDVVLSGISTRSLFAVCGQNGIYIGYINFKENTINTIVEIDF